MIRKGQLTDAEAIAALLITTWQTCYQTFLPKSFLDKLDVARQVQRQQRLIRSGNTYFVKEDTSGKIIGFASFGKPRSSEMLKGVKLYTLYVHPTYHKEGIGKGLLEKITQDQSVKGQILNVLVMEVNPYRTFYEQNGFQFHGKQKMDLGDFSVTNLLLIKQL